MSHTHAVVQGDTLASIAQEYGFRDWRRIWDHSDNAALRAKRGSPELLSPGDTVVVPLHEPKWVSVRTDAVHEFVVSRPVRSIALTLQRGDKSPFAGCRYALSAGGSEFEGIVPGSGTIKHRLTNHEAIGTLRLWPVPDADPVEVEVQLGHLESIDEPSGVLARLANLGHYHGDVDGSLEDEDAKLAIAAFRAEHEIDSEGIDVVRSELVRVYGG